MIPDGMIILASAHGPKATMDRFASAVVASGMAIFARIDHAGGALAVGMAMAPMEVLVFGAPKAGTPLMQMAPTIGIDLPLKALVWQDESGKVWLAYNQPAWIAKRHGLGAGAEPIVKAMTDALAKLAGAALAPSPD
jgi:uncharacterized protein (DUF302 family)